MRSSFLIGVFFLFADGKLVPVSTGVTGVSEKRRLADMNDAMELVLNDGTTIGHRAMNYIYKQKLKPENTNVADNLASVMEEYKRLQNNGLGSQLSLREMKLAKKAMVQSNKNAKRVCIYFFVCLFTLCLGCLFF